MTKLTPDAALLAQLTEPLELTDADGRTVGYFILPKQFERIEQLEEDRRTLYAHLNSQVTDEELEAADAAGGSYTHEEVWNRIRQLGAARQARSA